MKLIVLILVMFLFNVPSMQGGIISRPFPTEEERVHLRNFASLPFNQVDQPHPPDFFLNLLIRGLKQQTPSAPSPRLETHFVIMGSGRPSDCPEVNPDLKRRVIGDMESKLTPSFKSKMEKNRITYEFFYGKYGCLQSYTFKVEPQGSCVSSLFAARRYDYLKERETCVMYVSFTNKESAQKLYDLFLERKEQPFAPSCKRCCVCDSVDFEFASASWNWNQYHFVLDLFHLRQDFWGIPRGVIFDFVMYAKSMSSNLWKHDIRFHN